MEIVFIQLAMILFMAFIVSFIVRTFNQPIVIGYIFAGMIAAIMIEAGSFDFGNSTEIIGLFSEFGIAFLLFMVGLHLNPKVIKEIGTSALLIGLGQIILTFLLTFVVSVKILNFDLITSFYIGIALAFSSTIIIMKLISDQRQLDSLYGKISIGILIIQDLVAIIVLMLISSLSNGVNITSFAIRGLLGGAGLVFLLFLIGFFILPKSMKIIAKSQELLFLFSICWCFIIGALFSLMGFSLEIGALIAGVILSISPYSIEISSKIRPLRDFFLIIFFIILGINIHISNISVILVNAVILSVITLLFKPLIIMLFMRAFNYTKRTNFLVGTTLAQISEFSLIILALGVSIGHIQSEILSTLTLTLVITTIISTYMIIYSEKFYSKVSDFIGILEKKSVKQKIKVTKNYDAILFGYNRIGFGILQSLKRIKKRYLVVDFNPDVITDLKRFNIPGIYGDAYDQEFLEELPLDKIKIAISTIPSFEINLLLIKNIRLINPESIIIVRAHQIKDALELYQAGASYVLTPHFLGGEYIAKMIQEDKMDKETYKNEKDKHIKDLIKIMQRGKDHPAVEQG